MKNRWMGLLAVAALTGALHVTKAVAEDDKGDEKEVKVDLKDVPENVKKAATDAVKGLVLTEAEKETKDGKDIYELEGKVGDKKYEVEVDADGKVLKSGEDKDDDGKEGAEKRGEKHEKSGKAHSEKTGRKHREEKSEKEDD